MRPKAIRHKAEDEGSLIFFGILCHQRRETHRN